MKRAEEGIHSILAIEALLQGRIGLDPTSVSPNLVARGVRVRMAALGLKDLEDYEARLRHSPAELQELVEEVVIPESWFFRDEQPYGMLGRYAGDWLRDPAHRPPLRILSLPCARGEEPFSIAMSLRDAGIDRARFQIDGVDVGARNLAFARRGRYSANAFRGTDLAFRARYFRAQGSEYLVDPSILGSVRWIQASILDPGLLAGEPRYDVIFCRNLLIYLTAEAKLRTLRVLDRLLAGDGILFVGHADHLGLASRPGQPGTPGFVSVGDPACFAYRKRTAPANGIPLVSGSVQVVDAPSTAEFSFAEIASALPNVPVQPTPPADLPEGPVPSLLEQAARLADSRRHDEAIRLIEAQLRAKGPNAPAFHLMGIISQAAGDRVKAERCFNKAVYLDPGHDEALLALALLAERRGDAMAASSFRRRAERAVAAKGVS